MGRGSHVGLGVRFHSRTRTGNPDRSPRSSRVSFPVYSVTEDPPTNYPVRGGTTTTRVVVEQREQRLRRSPPEEPHPQRPQYEVDRHRPPVEPQVRHPLQHVLCVRQKVSDPWFLSVPGLGDGPGCPRTGWWMGSIILSSPWTRRSPFYSRPWWCDSRTLQKVPVETLDSNLDSKGPTYLN